MRNTERRKFVDRLVEEQCRRKWRIIFVISIIFFVLIAVIFNAHVKRGNEYGDFRHIVAYAYMYDDLPDNYIPSAMVGSLTGDDLYIYDVLDNDDDKLPIGDNRFISAYYNGTISNPGEERIAVFTPTSSGSFVLLNLFKTQVFYTDDDYASYRKVTRIEIFGPYYLSLLALSVAIVYGGVVTLVALKKKIITGEIIKSDISKDFQLLGAKTKAVFCKKKKD